MLPTPSTVDDGAFFNTSASLGAAKRPNTGGDGEAQPLADTNEARRERPQRTLPKNSNAPRGVNTADGGWWETEPDMGRVANGVAARVDRLKALGNGQVPAVAATAWNLLDEL